MPTSIHFLHIGKTGGNAIKEAISPFVSHEVPIILHPHQMSLADVPEHEKAFFALRDPVDRFVSGFNSRRRCGRPRNNSRWNDEERTAFGRFATANDLALALSSTDEAQRNAAKSAMMGIRHVNSRYSDWLLSTAYLDQRWRDILWVGLTSRLSDDFELLKQLLGLPANCLLPSDPVVAHRRLPSDEVLLSPEAEDNVRQWYAAEYEFLDYFFKAETSAGPC